jgi:hypothetical protein
MLAMWASTVLRAIDGRSPMAWFMGLIGASLMISSALGQVVGINSEYSAWSAIALVPIFLLELTVGLWLGFKGFKPSAPIMVEAAAAEVGRPDRPNYRRSPDPGRPCHLTPER